MKDLKPFIYHFGIDHLEIYGTFKDEQFFISHSVKIIAGYDIERSYKVPNYQYKITFKKDDVPVMAFQKGITDQRIPTKDYFIIYGLGFRLIDELNIWEMLLYLNLKSLKRFDIAIDLKLPIKEVLSHFWKITQKSAQFNDSFGQVQTQYIGEAQRSKNRRQLIRIYDKQADTRVRGKEKFYADYMVQPDITRIELEVRRELAQNTDYKRIFDKEVLSGILKNYLKKHTSLLDSLNPKSITLHKKETGKLNTDVFQSVYYKDQRRKIFLGHGKSVYELGFCPVRALILEGYVQDDTKLILGIEKIETLFEKERVAKELAKERKYFRENSEEILSNLYKYGEI